MLAFVSFLSFPLNVTLPIFSFSSQFYPFNEKIVLNSNSLSTRAGNRGSSTQESMNAIAVYRLIGNDMPPLQSSGQLLRNTLFALKNEPEFTDGIKKWVLNRIWNETMFGQLYDSLISHGVNRRDILIRCFQIEEYVKLRSYQDRMLYLTAQNEARNDAIQDAKALGFKWSVILDGNTFITIDSWENIKRALANAQNMGMAYAKIPYHRLHEPQSTRWLHESTTTRDVLRHAPAKGESQMAFHISANQSFSLGNTRTDRKFGKKRGYGQRNKSYLFKDGQVCSQNSGLCMCADVEEGNEEDMASSIRKNTSYVDRCGLVLRLWSFPTEYVIDTGLPAADEVGFYCFLEKVRNSISAKSECSLINKALLKWAQFREEKKFSFKLSKQFADECKIRYSFNILTQSCLRAAARERAQKNTDLTIQLLYSASKQRAVSLRNTSCLVFRDTIPNNSNGIFVSKRDKLGRKRIAEKVTKTSEALAISVTKDIVFGADGIINHENRGTSRNILLSEIVILSWGWRATKNSSYSKAFGISLNNFLSNCDLICLLNPVGNEIGFGPLHFFHALKFSEILSRSQMKRLRTWSNDLKLSVYERGDVKKLWIPFHMTTLAAMHFFDREGDFFVILQRLLRQLNTPFPLGYFHPNGSIPFYNIDDSISLAAVAERLLWWLETAQYVESIRIGNPCTAPSFWYATHGNRIISPDIMTCNPAHDKLSPILCKAIKFVMGAVERKQASSLNNIVFFKICTYGNLIYNLTSTCKGTISGDAAWIPLWRNLIGRPKTCDRSSSHLVFQNTSITLAFKESDERQRKFFLSTLRASRKISSNLFQYAIERPEAVIYRIVSNEIPPLLSQEAVIRNIDFILREESFFEGAQKKWILHRIWNQSFFMSVYGKLVTAGVSRDDILIDCFDMKDYAGIQSFYGKMEYLYPQNRDKEAALLNGLSLNNFKWAIVMDANTFIPFDSWLNIQQAMITAQRKGMTWIKIPQHRLTLAGNMNWLTQNEGNSIRTLLAESSQKWVSDVGYSRNSLLSGSDGLFEKGMSACLNSSVRNTNCKCAEFDENYRLSSRRENKDFLYLESCGVSVRLKSNSNYQDFIQSHFLREHGIGFFCFLERMRGKLRSSFTTECAYFKSALRSWKSLNQSVQNHFELLRDTKSSSCLSRYLPIVLSSLCFEDEFKKILISEELKRIESVHVDHLSELLNSSAVTYEATIWNQGISMCSSISKNSPRSGSLHLEPRKQSSRTSFLMSFHAPSLSFEKEKWQQHTASDLSQLIFDLLRKANRGLSLGPYSVTSKLQSTKDGKRYYFSFRPYLWPYNLLPRNIQKQVSNGQLKLDPPCCLHRDGHRVPGTVIGGPGENNFDRSSAWYVIDNVTTLALAWYFSDDIRYARHGAHLIDTYFLSNTTGMLPTLKYAQNGYKYGLIDWKDVYYLLDAVTLLHQSGQLSPKQFQGMKEWCSRLGHWIIQSDMGSEEAKALNNHGLYFDVTTFALFLFSEEDYYVKTAKNRLLFRLAKEFPIGHFDRMGNQPHETSRPTGLHYITFNLVGWIHAAVMNEAVRMTSPLPAGELSLWLVKHEYEANDRNAQPVLCKAIRQLSAFLPTNASAFERYTDPSSFESFGVFWPFEQADAFAFDRMLEIIRYGVRVYGMKSLFQGGEIPINVRIALNYPLYSTTTATFTRYSSVHPDSGNRGWSSLGLANTTEPIPYIFARS